MQHEACARKLKRAKGRNRLLKQLIPLANWRKRQARPALGWRDAELVVIAGLRIDRDEAGGLLASSPTTISARRREGDRRSRRAGVEINRNAGRRPGRSPEIDQRRQIGLGKVP